MNSATLELVNAPTNSKSVNRGYLEGQLREAGIHAEDPRIASLNKYLESMEPGEPITMDAIENGAAESRALLGKAISNRLVVPRFGAFRSMIEELFHKSKKAEGGAVASYIPQLKRVNPNLFGVSICTIDGQQLSLGDSNAEFCMQSACKAALYCSVLELLGQGLVHRHMGWEPSGRSFNELALNQRNQPHNPMINAGAIMSCALLMPESPMSERFDHLLKMLAGFSGNRRPGFNNSVYLSERETADRNHALAYYMKEVGAFPEGTDLHATLDLYFSACSIETTTRQMAMHAATLANAGVCPLTGSRVIKENTAKNCLSMMYSCGMYDYSGEFAFRVGLPAKSGVSGVVMAVVPNLMGIAVYSPRIDAMGNSVRGVEFLKSLVDTYNMHNYDSLTRTHKIDPRQH